MAHTVAGVTMTLMKLLQSARLDDSGGSCRAVPVTNRAQLSALHAALGMPPDSTPLARATTRTKTEVFMSGNSELSTLSGIDGGISNI